MNETKTLDTATFGGGCFWCVEAIYQQVEGVKHITSGYSGGTVENPTYEQVCTGATGHAEVAQIVYDSALVNFDQLLAIFFETHDPTTLNRQGNDAGTQYRSVIFYHDEDQKRRALAMIEELGKKKVYDDPIVTEVTPFTKFYPAEDYHQNYFASNRSQPYCRMVIEPKVRKFLEKYRKGK